MISLGPIFAIMMSRSHDGKNRPEGDHKVVIKGPPVCPDNNFVNVWELFAKALLALAAVRRGHQRVIC